MNNKSVINFFPALLAGILVISCTTNKQPDPFQEFRKEIKEVHPRLMLSSDAALLIEKSEAEYIPELTLSTAIIDKYMKGDSLEFLSNEIQAAGLMGIYTADVVYHLAFSNREEAFESYSSAQLIANELGFGDIYISNLLSRHESAEFSIDSMIIEIDRALAKVNEEYTDTDRLRIILAFTAANYIEKGYYIHATLQSYKDKEIDPSKKILLAKEFILVILSQEQAINTLIDLVEKNSYAEDKGLFLKELKVLREEFSRIAPLNEKVDELMAADVFENSDFDAMYSQLQKIRGLITTGVED